MIHQSDSERDAELSKQGDASTQHLSVDTCGCFFCASQLTQAESITTRSCHLDRWDDGS